MRINNVTHWRSDHIMAIVKRVAENELDAEQRKRFSVMVSYRRARRGSTGVSGRAPYGGRYIRLFLSRHGVDPASLAHTAAHEFAHTRGMRHRAMRGSIRYSYASGWREYVAWADTMPVEAKPKPVKARTTTAAQLELVRERVSLWTRKRKLADTYLKKWTRKANRLETTLRLAASSAESPGAP